MFGSGPRLTHDAKEFLCRLAAHPDIEFLGAFCQAEAQSFKAIFQDLWRRRGLLAVPLFLAWLAEDAGRFVFHPQAEIKLNKRLATLSSQIHFITDIHAEAVLAQISSLAPDLGLIYGSPILKPALFEIPALGTLGIHHGKVPEYRGNKTTFWAMYNGEGAVGVTIQKINAGLDTGQIVKAGQVATGRRSYRTVWHELETLGLDLYIQAILEIKAGTATLRPQTGKKGKLYRNPKLSDLLTFSGKQLKKRWSKS
jgi:folate-dependent phosphoribosylglycinamide formyltransferase PurN